MSDSEFERVSSGIVRSRNGFTVTTRLQGGVIYEDGAQNCFVDSEWMGKENGIILYLTSPSNEGLTGLNAEQAARVISNISRALEYQTYAVELRGE